MQVLYHQLADVEAKLTLAEQTRNSLAQELHQAQVDEDNLRNRYNVYKGLRATNRMQMKAGFRVPFGNGARARV